MRVTCGASLVLLSVAMASRAAKAELYWENGDFAIPKPAPKSFALIDTGERYGVWRVIGAPGNVTWVSGDYTHNGFSFPAQGTGAAQGEPWVNLAAISMTPTGIMHAPVPTTVGKSYTLTFYVGNIVDPSGIYGTSSTINVYENATLIGTAINSNGGGTKVENWKPFSITFKADAPYTTIAFINGDPPGDMNCGVSNTLFGPTGGASAQGSQKGGRP